MSSPSDTDIKVEIKPTLTPPTSEDKHDDSDSELSDLELDGDTNGEILPDHYYDGGKIPVFKPVSSLCLSTFCILFLLLGYHNGLSLCTWS